MKRIMTSIVLIMMVLSSINAQTMIKKKDASQLKDEAVRNGAKSKNDVVAYTVAQNYFVLNSVAQGGLAKPKIETKAEFDKYFGMAPVMGNNGKPTVIDFAKQFVIAVILDDTDLNTEILSVSLLKNAKKQLVFTYSVKVGAKQSFTIRPALIIVVDKTNNAPVVLQLQKK
jgi:hypothetical protein